MPRVKFPHFTPEEAEVLEAFMRAKIIDGKWSFDIRLPSQKGKLKGIHPDWVIQMWNKVTAKRIDALCETADSIHIIEVKRYLMASGIGQLIVYKYLYEKYYKPEKPIQLWLIAMYDDPDVREVCGVLGIRVWTIYKWTPEGYV